MFTRFVLLCITLLLWSVMAHAQTPTVDCVPIQGQGWQGCAPIGNNQHTQEPMPLPPRWADRWGALAGDSVAGVLGSSENMPDKRIAEDVAMANCQENGGKHCEIISKYHNGCIAMVLGKARYRIFVGPTIDAATKIAMQTCNREDADCGVYYSACSYPVRIQ